MEHLQSEEPFSSDPYFNCGGNKHPAEWVEYLYEGSCKVEKILKGSLIWIPSPSPSVKIQIMGGKVSLRCKGKTLLGVANKIFNTKITLQSALLPQVTFPANKLNFL